MIKRNHFVYYLFVVVVERRHRTSIFFLKNLSKGCTFKMFFFFFYLMLCVSAIIKKTTYMWPFFIFSIHHIFILNRALYSLDFETIFIYNNNSIKLKWKLNKATIIGVFCFQQETILFSLGFFFFIFALLLLLFFFFFLTFVFKL